MQTPNTIALRADGLDLVFEVRETETETSGLAAGSVFPITEPNLSRAVVGSIVDGIFKPTGLMRIQIVPRKRGLDDLAELAADLLDRYNQAE